jgi:hypothetical protein
MSIYYWNGLVSLKIDMSNTILKKFNRHMFHPHGIITVGPWLWKEAKNKEEKGKSKLCGRHSDCHWVKVSKREGKMEQSAGKQVVGWGDQG